MIGYEVLVQKVQILWRIQFVPQLRVQYDLEVFEACELPHDVFVWETAEPQRSPGIMFHVRIDMLEDDSHPLECSQLRGSKIVNKPTKARDSINAPADDVVERYLRKGLKRCFVVDLSRHKQEL